MSQGNFISRALSITADNRTLWGLAWLAALSTGSGAIGIHIDPTTYGLNPLAMAGGDLYGQLADTLSVTAALNGIRHVLNVFGGYAFLLWTLSFVLQFLGMVARIGMVQIVGNSNDAFKSDKRFSLRDGWHYLPRLLLVKAVLYLTLYGLHFGGGFLVRALGFGLFDIVMVPFLLLYAVLMYSTLFADAFAFRAIVLNDMGVIESVRHGWRVYRRNWWMSFKLGVVFTVIGFIVTSIIGAVLVRLTLGSTDLVAFWTTGELSSAESLRWIFGSLLSSMIGALFLCLIDAWQSATFTLAYQEFSTVSAKPIETTPEIIIYNEKASGDFDFGTHQ